MAKTSHLALALGAGSVLLAGAASAQAVVRISDLDFGRREPNLTRAIWLNTAVGQSCIPRVAIDEAPAWLGSPKGVSGINPGALLDADVAIETEVTDKQLHGTLFLSDRDGRTMQAYRFAAPSHHVKRDPARYRAAMAAHYDMLAGTDLPGGPWFRRRAQAYGSDLSRLSQWGSRRSYGAGDAFAMFTGGRALAENLRLDEVIQFEENAGALTPIGEIAGIEVPAMGFAGLLDERRPAFDSLADSIPEDQFAVFFPRFEGLIEVVDELSSDAAPLVQLVDRRAEQSLVRERYEAQLCLELNGVVRALGPRVVTEVAFTGSDPYMRTGADVALLLRGNVAGIRGMIANSQVAAAKAAGVEPRTVKVAGWDAAVVETPDRGLSSWLVATDSMVIVANSQHQLRRVIETNDGTSAPLSRTDEYRWFRQRYALDDAATSGGEEAFIVVSDAAIREWAGAKWRIGTARRIKAAAQLADVDAWRIARELEVPAGEDPELESVVAGGGEIDVAAGGAARDSVYGTRSFLTPVAELAIDLASDSERRGYEAWRRRFERAWGGAFDPIAARIDVREGGTHLDMTLVPLVMRTDYRELLDLVGQERLSARSPAPSPSALVHFAGALNRQGGTFRLLNEALPSAAFGGDGALGWVGHSIAIWLDQDDEYFERIRETDSVDSFVEEALPGLPIAVRIDVDNRIGAAAFLTGIRTLIGDAVPGWVEYSTGAHMGREYVVMELSDDIGFDEPLFLHYVLLPDGLVFSFSRKVIERVIEAHGKDRPTVDWSDRGVALHVRGEVRELADIEWLGLASKDQLLSRSWGNLAILNEWKRLGAADPVAFHEEHWGSRLVCPGGGEYVWNAAHQTMESTVFGHPAAPKEGPILPPTLEALGALDIGLAFERFGIDPREGEVAGRRQQFVNGLRAMVTLRRAEK